MSDSLDRKAMVEALHKRYGQSGWRMQLRVFRKKTLWNFVIQGSLALKRLLDLAGALMGVVLFSPIFLATAIAIKAEDRGPVLFRQERVGAYGKLFTMLKFRSMYVNADAKAAELADKNESGKGVLFKMKHDPRITKTGAIIRKLSIDELPQFFNVLQGSMSLVGPRPALPREVEQYTMSDRARLAVKPGITCLWQISGRSDLDFQQQVALDKAYIESATFADDIRILLKTIPAVLGGKGAY